MQVGTLYTRVVPCGTRGDYMLVAGFSRGVNRTTAEFQATLSALTSVSLFDTEKRAMEALGAASTVDVTDASIRKKLNKLFESQPGSYIIR